MRWSDVQFNPSDRTLRQFAALCLIVFGAMGLLEFFWRHHQERAIVYAGLALVLGPLGLIRPRAVKPIFVGWSVVAFPIGWLVSTVMLAVLFYAVFTPIGLFFRAMGRDVLALRRTTADTYWKAKPAARDARDYFRQS